MTKEEIEILRKLVNKEIKHKNISLDVMTIINGQKLENFKEVEEYYKTRNNGLEMIQFIKEEYSTRRALEMIDEKLKEMEKEV